MFPLITFVVNFIIYCHYALSKFISCSETWMIDQSARIAHLLFYGGLNYTSGVSHPAQLSLCIQDLTKSIEKLRMT